MGAVELVAIVAIVVVVVGADVSAELTVSTTIVVEVASGIVVDGTSEESAVLTAALDDPDAPMPSAGSELAP